ncbi:hypothetical protein [Flavobacterium sp. WC2509]|uniref:hypothetical protein n=1 Tax=Flavobacterium sp. WC2509 TaxID=3461406 RepID=UPI004043FF85
MKELLKILVFCYPVFSFGQSIFSNSIVGANPNSVNPFVADQVVNLNISASGIGRGSALFGIDANNRYDAKSWGLLSFDPNAYFEFVITPNIDQKIDFENFEFTGQISLLGPTRFSFRSSVDNFASDITMVSNIGSAVPYMISSTVSLAGMSFQNVTTPIKFRIYGFAALAGTGSFSVNDFNFNGKVSCAQPQAVVLPAKSISCTATSFDLQWPASLLANNYFIDVAKEPDFLNFVPGYQNKELGNVLVETISGLGAGSSYYVRLRATNHCEVSANSNTIEVSPPVTVYNNGWSNGLPDINKNVQFSSDFNVNSLLEACSCKIDDLAAVHVESDAIVKLQNNLNFMDGNLTFENGASLIQINDLAINTGKIIYNRTTSAVNDFDYVYWSSPVVGQMMGQLSSSSDKYWSWLVDNWAPVSGSSEMLPAKGYIARVPLGGLSPQNVVFKGIPHNGLVTIASQGVNKSNLIGNPYPSAIDADLFMIYNKGIINGALYFWAHKKKRELNVLNNQYEYAANDYATYTLLGATKPGEGMASGSLSMVPLGKIAAGQSFFVDSKRSGNFTFNNSMRITDSGMNSQFFKQQSTKKITAIVRNRVWLNLTNDQGAFKQLLVGYMAGATNDFDNLYDGTTLDGNVFIDFYSVCNAKNYTIQGRSLPFDALDEVPLGYKTTIAGTFKIGIDTIDGFLTEQEIYLEDKMTNKIHNLKNEPYLFTTEIGVFSNRFVLRYTDNSKLGTDVQSKGKGIVISVENQQIKINSANKVLTSVKLYDLKGSLLYEKSNLDKNEFVINHLIVSNQLMIVVAEFEDGKRASEEIIFHK